MKKSLIALLVALAFVLSSCGAIASPPLEASEGSTRTEELSEERPEEPFQTDEPTEEYPEAPTEDPTETPETVFLPQPKAPETTETPKNKVAYLRSNVDGLNVRAGAGTNYAVLGSLDKNDMSVFVGKTGDWYETTYRNQTAYVSAKYVDVVDLDPADEATEKVISLGCLYLGTPYVYGATRLHDGKGNLLPGFSDQRFDCSSFMQYVFYYGKGTLLDVTTRTQVKQGAPVELSEIKRGDLLFFTNAARKNNVGVEKIGHVALYLGDDYILHTASDHAVIEPMSATRKANLLFARRICGASAWKDRGDGSTPFNMTV